MTQADKLLARMRANAHGWTIEDIIRVCSLAGLTCNKPSSGSHYKISHDKLNQILTVPFKRPIKPVYVRMLLQMIDDVKAGR